MKLWAQEERERAMKSYEAELAKVVGGNLPEEHIDRKTNRVILPDEYHKELQEKLQPWLAGASRKPVATSVGYPVVADYDARIQGWTTQSHQVTLDNGWRILVLYSYPNGHKRRRTDNMIERFTYDPLRKPRPEEWKERVEARSVVPTLVAMPQDVVAMPFIPMVNMYDVFAHNKLVKNWGRFQRVHDLPFEAKVDKLAEISLALASLHSRYTTWGEAILQNVGCTDKGMPIWVDAEMRYQGLSLEREMAMDVRNLIISSTGAMARGDVPSDIIQAVLQPHATAVLEELDQLAATRMPFLQRYVFDHFGKYRLGALDYEHFQRAMAATRRELHDLL